MATAVFPGSFNPFTIGHKSIVERALPLFDRIIVGVGYNEHKSDAGSVEERVEAIRRIFASEPRVEAVAYTGLTVDLARRTGASFMVRGVRNVTDFDYERTLADVNRRISGIETVFIPSLPELADISSSMVRELSHNGVDTTPFIPSTDNNSEK
ncbi:MAG: pantetheine-phosphate adenylyltransferase [Muribaculaceae bacterium]|nr:pantetheine-phosphate adenylyltransferase [Muribaculaceae bacterium]